MSLRPALPVMRSDRPIHTMRQKSTQLYQLLRRSRPKVASSAPKTTPYFSSFSPFCSNSRRSTKKSEKVTFFPSRSTVISVSGSRRRSRNSSMSEAR